MTVVFLSLRQFAARVGVSPATLNKYKLPAADAEIDGRRGWLPETIDAWSAARPGQGARTDLRANPLR